MVEQYTRPDVIYDQADYVKQKSGDHNENVAFKMFNKAIMAIKFLTEDKEQRLVVPPPPRGTREGKELW